MSTCKKCEKVSKCDFNFRGFCYDCYYNEQFQKCKSCDMVLHSSYWDDHENMTRGVGVTMLYKIILMIQENYSQPS